MYYIIYMYFFPEVLLGIITVIILSTINIHNVGISTHAKGISTGT